MSGFIQGTDRQQATLFPERLDEYIAEDNTVRVIDVCLTPRSLRAGLQNPFGEHGSSSLPPHRPAALYLRVSEPSTVESPSGTRSPPQRLADVAHRTLSARL